MYILLSELHHTGCHTRSPDDAYIELYVFKQIIVATRDIVVVLSTSYIFSARRMHTLLKTNLSSKRPNLRTTLLAYDVQAKSI